MRKGERAIQPKQILKIIIDIFMTAGLLFLMGYQFWGDLAHEWVGAGMFVLFLVHHFLNGSWHKHLLRGKYRPIRIAQLVVDVLVLLSMIGLMVSGILLSNHVFAWIPVRGSLSFARLLHMAASHWGFVLMALHLGMHWNMFLGMAGKAVGLHNRSRSKRLLLWLLGAAIAVYGLTVFFRRDLPTYLFLKTQFVFMDFNESVLLFYLDYLAMMGTFIFLAHLAAGLLRRTGNQPSRDRKKRR